MDKLTYLAETFRQTNKKYENFVVNAIWQRLGNDRNKLQPITQQFVYNMNNPKQHYFIDLYFPQIHLGIEVDEGQHETDFHKRSDKERTANIFDAMQIVGIVESDIIRIKITSDGKTLRSNEDVSKDIDNTVKKIEEKVKEVKPRDWEFLTPKEFYEGKKEFFTADNQIFKTHAEVYNTLFGQNVKGDFKAGKLIDGNYVWFPALSVKLPDGTIIQGHKDWDNILSADGKTLKEIGKVEHKADNKEHIVFAKILKHPLGNNGYKFIGVFKMVGGATKREDDRWERTFEKIADKFSIKR